MGKFDRVLLLTDLDGTLLDDQKKIGQKSREAIAYFEQEGGHFSAATGRLHRFFRPSEYDLPLNCPALCANGGYLYDYRTGERACMHFLAEGFEDVVCDVLSRFPTVCAEYHTFSTTYLCRINDVSRHHMEVMRITDPVTLDDPRQAPQEVIKVLFAAPAEEAKAISEYMQDRPMKNFDFVFSTPVFYEMLPAGVNKGDAALGLCKYLGLDRKDLYTAGDNLNDLDLLKVASIGFAPSNCHPTVASMPVNLLSDNNHDMMADLIAFLDQKY